MKLVSSIVWDIIMSGGHHLFRNLELSVHLTAVTANVRN